MVQLREKEEESRNVLCQKNLLQIRTNSIEDSLKYAQRIQKAMFTPPAEVRGFFPDSFIFERPKDIVSGDFYWAKRVNGKILFWWPIAPVTGFREHSSRYLVSNS